MISSIAFTSILVATRTGQRCPLVVIVSVVVVAVAVVVISAAFASTWRVPQQAAADCQQDDANAAPTDKHDEREKGDAAYQGAGRQH